MNTVNQRHIYEDIFEVLSSMKSLLLLSGPRQTGKTTLAKSLCSQFKNQMYFNYDFLDSKKVLASNPRFFEEVNRLDASLPFIVLDEFHKFPNWKNYLKGVFDEYAEAYRFLVTGSGRLDLYRKGGDSLAGRYLLFHLWPFTVAELANKRISFEAFWSDPIQVPEPASDVSELWESLLHSTGFPEPFIKGKTTFTRLWSENYQHQLIREDIRDAFAVRQIDAMQTLFSLLPERTGSLLSMNALSKLIQVGFGTTQTWMDLFEQFYLIFRISPWSKQISRAIRKEKKLYLFDTFSIKDPGQRFENRVALELHRATSNWNDLGLGKFSLHFIRDKDKREVDFLIADDDTPKLLIECKLNHMSPSRSLVKFQGQLNVPAIQLVNKDGVCKLIKHDANKVMVVTASQWLAMLP